jgi:hypothetical protein
MTNSRKLSFVDRDDFAGWVCSECGWTFRPPETDATRGADTLDSFIRRSQLLADDAFAAHACTNSQNRQKAKAC